LSARHPITPLRVGKRYNPAMYIIAVAWLYVALIAAVSDTTVVGGTLTFIFYGVLPLALFLWLFGTPARHRRQRSQASDSSAQDGDNSGKNQ